MRYSHARHYIAIDKYCRVQQFAQYSAYNYMLFLHNSSLNSNVIHIKTRLVCHTFLMKKTRGAGTNLKRFICNNYEPQYFQASFFYCKCNVACVNYSTCRRRGGVLNSPHLFYFLRRHRLTNK